MQISRALFERMVQLFASASNALMSTTTGANIRLQPVNVPFNPGLDLVLADVPRQATLVNTEIEAMPDLPPFFYTDVLTQERVAVFNVLNWPLIFVQNADGGPVNLYGTRLVSFDNLTLLATQTLPAPVVLSANGQGTNSPRLEFRFPASIVR